MKKHLIILIPIVLILSNCTKDFEEYAAPKTTSDRIDPDYLFTRALITGSGLSVGVWQLIHQTSGSAYAQHWANIKPGFTSDNYEPFPGNSVWNWYYARAYFASLNLNYNVLELSRELENPIKEACARIWNVYMVHMVSDMYGDIPYTEAFVELKPRFDNQKDIYEDLLAELVDAVNQIKENKDKGYESFGEADVLYQADLDKWIAFGNTLLMRLCLRVSNVAENEMTVPYLSEIDVSETMLTNDDMAKIIPDPAGPTYHVKNPLQYVYGWHEVRMSELMYNFMTGYEDPRLYYYAEPNEAGEYVGLRNGQTQEDLNLEYNSRYKPDYCNIGSFFTNDYTPHYLLTFAEACFLKAEAAQKGWIAGSAEQFYNEGIRASMEELGIANDSIVAYINGNAAFDVSKALEQIYEQRWIALYPNGNEAWNLIRRTGYPQILQPVYTWPDNNEMPRRVPYPVAERRYNEENFDAAVSRMGGDTQYTRVWWDGGN